MKIDLHVHTLEDDKGNSGRNISSPMAFVKTLISSGVGLAAITNHNILNIEQFKEILNEAKNEKIEILPGVELDVNIININGEKVRRQVNIIYPQDEYEELAQKIKDNPSSPGNPIDIEKAIEAYQQKNSIFSFDMKGHNTQWDEWEIKKYFDNNFEPAIIRDTNNAKTHFLLASKKQAALIGSDLKNWSEYEAKDSLKLIDSNYDGLNFYSLINIIKGEVDLEVFTKSIEEKTLDNIKYKDAKWKLDNLKITSGVNIIFGPKSTGKTELLQALYDKNDNSKLIYLSEDRDTKFVKLKDEWVFSKENEAIKKKFDDKIKILIDYKEENYNQFNKYFLSISNANSTNIKIGEVIFDFMDVPEKQNKVGISESAKDLYSYTNNEISNELRMRLKDNIVDISKEIRDKYINSSSEYYFNELIKEIKNNVNEVLSSNKGIVASPNDIGLFELYLIRKNMWRTYLNIKNGYNDIYEKNNEFDIPNGNKIKKVTTIKFVNFSARGKDSKMFYGEKFKHGTKRFFEESILKLNTKPFLSDPSQELSKLRKLFDEIGEFSKFGSYFYKDDIKTEFKPSNSERAFMVLSNELNTSKNNIYLDEPGTYLGSEMITEYLIPKIIKLNLEGKHIFITTHMSNIGINSMPYNFIYKSNVSNDEGKYKTYSGNFGTLNFVNLDDKKDNLNFNNTLMNNFEGGENNYNFRRSVYERSK